MRFVYLFIIAMFVSSCDMSSPYEPSEKQQLVNEIRHKVAFKLRKEKELIPFGSGGQMMDQVQMLYLAFQYREKVDVEAGRKLLIAAVQEFLDAVNKEERLCQYLGNVPFEAKNIIVEIYLKNPDGTNLGLEDFCIISAHQGILEYEISNPKTNRLEKVYKETYEEALQKMAD